MQRTIFYILIIIACIISYIYVKKEQQKPMSNNLIPREVLFGNPAKALTKISHDGKYISYISSVNNVLNVFVADTNAIGQAYPITNDKERGIRQYFWLYTNKNIIYLKDDGGDENWQIHTVDIKTKEDKTLSPQKVNAQIYAVSDKFPEEILIGLNDRDEAYHDLYKLNVITGEKDLIFKNEEKFREFILDNDYRIRFASKAGKDGITDYFKVSQTLENKYEFSPYFSVGLEDVYTTTLLGLTNDGKTLYMLDSIGKDLNSLKAINTENGESEVLGEGKNAEINSLITSPKTGIAEAYSVNYLKNKWTSLDNKFQKHLYALSEKLTGEISISSRTLDDTKWIVADIKDNGPTSYYLYNSENYKLDFLFFNREDLANYKLSKMEPIVIEARDGLKMPSYITKPLNSTGLLPLVLLVHGGPWARDDWGYDAEAQWLANRGYAVLQINFRSSRGFGKSFIEKGNLEWGGKMHEDLLDGVNWAIDQKIADPTRIAIYGGSYGGYAALWGATNSSDVFKCAVDIVGPSNINTLLSTFPAYWASFMEVAYKQIGDPRTEEGQKFLKARSPLTYVNKVSIPILIAQGEKDPRVKQDESEQFVKAMKEKNLPYIYMLFMNEGHGFARPENKFAFYGTAEEFLANNLSGKAQNLTNELDKSTLSEESKIDIINQLKKY